MSHLRLDQLCKEYPTRAEPVVVLRGVSLEMGEGETAAIVGPSGSGKSTLLSVIGTLEPATSGRVEIDGQNPAELDEPALADLRSRKIGFVFQDSHLLPQCSVLENVLVPTISRGRTTPEDVDRARSLLDRVGLSSRSSHLPSELSGGERQRAALARALIGRPSLLLADEPTGNLDRATAARVAELLLELQREEPSILLVATHSPALADLMRRRYELDEGRLKESTCHGSR